MPIAIKVPLDLVLERRYFRLKPYLDKFIEDVESQGLANSANDYEVAIEIVKKDDKTLIPHQNG
jgi:hypothetical protein